MIAADESVFVVRLLLNNAEPMVILAFRCTADYAELLPLRIRVYSYITNMTASASVQGCGHKLSNMRCCTMLSYLSVSGS